MIVNTSFNVRGEPIVCTPEDAFRCFMGTDIEVLAVGNCFLRKEEQDPKLTKDYKSLRVGLMTNFLPLTNQSSCAVAKESEAVGKVGFSEKNVKPGDRKNLLVLRDDQSFQRLAVKPIQIGKRSVRVRHARNMPGTFSHVRENRTEK